MDLYKPVFLRDNCLNSGIGFVLILFVVGTVWSVVGCDQQGGGCGFRR